MTERNPITRRAVLEGIAGSAGALSLVAPAVSNVAQAQAGEPRAASGGSPWTSIVVGAGTFGAWTAWNLLRKGERVLLLDAWGPAHARVHLIRAIGGARDARLAS